MGDVGIQFSKEASGPPGPLEVVHEPLERFGSPARVVVVGSGRCRERVDQDQPASPFGTARGVQRGHRPRHRARHQHDTSDARGGHHRVQVVGPSLQSRQLVQRHRIRDPRAPLVVRNDSRERRQPVGERPSAWRLGILVRQPRWDRHDLVRPMPVDPEGEPSISAHRVAEIVLVVHGHILAPTHAGARARCAPPSRETTSTCRGRRGYGRDVKKPRVLEMTGRERMWMLESTITGMLGAFVAKDHQESVQGCPQGSSRLGLRPEQRRVLVARCRAVGGGRGHRPRHREGDERAHRDHRLEGRHGDPPARGRRGANGDLSRDACAHRAPPNGHTCGAQRRCGVPCWHG